MIKHVYIPTHDGQICQKHAQYACINFVENLNDKEVLKCDDQSEAQF